VGADQHSHRVRDKGHTVDVPAHPSELVVSLNFGRLLDRDVTQQPSRFDGLSGGSRPVRCETFDRLMSGSGQNEKNSV
jgi:hypothetical protein